MCIDLLGHIDLSESLRYISFRAVDMLCILFYNRSDYSFAELRAIVCSYLTVYMYVPFFPSPPERSENKPRIFSISGHNIPEAISTY